MSQSDNEKIPSVLEDALEKADASLHTALARDDSSNLEIVMTNFESADNTSVLHVLITLLAKKIVSPGQDVRYHQANMEGGFSGRSLDTKYVTPFLGRNHLSRKPTSGWLTRSLEQSLPYTKDYPGQITPKELRKAFLDLVDRIQNDAELPKNLLYAFFAELVHLRERDKNLKLARPKSKTVSGTVNMVKTLWEERNASRIPVLAMYAAYQSMIKEIARYKRHNLESLLPHTASDDRSNRAGDIDLVLEGKTVESVEVKHDIGISADLVEQLIEKIKKTSVKRFYILSTSDSIKDAEKINSLLLDAKTQYGCEVIVNGVAPTLEYYLRLMKDTDDFIENFVTLLETDEGIGYSLKTAWNEIR